MTTDERINLEIAKFNGYMIEEKDGTIRLVKPIVGIGTICEKMIPQYDQNWGLLISTIEKCK